MVESAEVRELIEHFGLEPLPVEGGYYRVSYTSTESFPWKAPDGSVVDRSVGSGIYYLITPRSWSAIHMLTADELWHFYFGDPVEQLQLNRDGTGRVVRLGRDWRAGEVQQLPVESGVWQGTRLSPGGSYALLGTSVHPGYIPSDYKHGNVDDLCASYPAWAEQINWLSEGV